MMLNNQSILNELRDYFDGLILSDGYVKCSNRVCYYQQSCVEFDWLSIINKDLYDYGIISKISTVNRKIPDKNLQYEIRTYSYVEFKEVRSRYYIRDYNVDEYPTRLWNIDNKTDEWFVWKKIVPKDICLSPECVLNWYLGDGNFDRFYNHIRISTDGFFRSDVVFLSELLSDVIDIKCSLGKRSMITICNRVGVSKFFDYIGSCNIPNCYNRKFR